jgi:hypothetical protein
MITICGSLMTVSVVLVQNVGMAREDSMMLGVPERAVCFQEMYSARSRVVLLQQLLGQAMTFPELRDRVDMSPASVREGLNDLERMGYVGSDSPEGRQRKSSKATFFVHRHVLVEDLAETFKFLLG